MFTSMSAAVAYALRYAPANDAFEVTLWEASAEERKDTFTQYSEDAIDPDEKVAFLDSSGTKTDAWSVTHISEKGVRDWVGIVLRNDGKFYVGYAA